MAKNNFIVLDCETGGIDEKSNPITQVALMVIDPSNFAILEQYENFIKPYEGLVIKKEAINASRVSMSEINAGVEYVKVIADLIRIFSKHSPKGKIPAKPIIVGHNTQFDIRFLKELFKFKSKDLFDFIDPFFYDTLRMIKDYEMNIKGSENFVNKLEVVCQRYGIELKSAHGAMNDVIATREIFSMLMSNFRTSGKSSKGGKTVADIDKTKSRKFFELP